MAHTPFAKDLYLLNSQREVGLFSEAVREVAAEMGLIDPFQAWYRPDGPFNVNVNYDVFDEDN